MPARFDHRSSGVTPAWRRLLPGAGLVGCSLGLSVSLGCVSPSLHSEAVDVVRNADLVQQCTLKSEGTYTALGEKNALVLARNAVVKNGGNVFFLMSSDKSDTLTTTVNGKIYACKR